MIKDMAAKNYDEIRQLIINTLEGRPAGTMIYPEGHQEIDLSILDFANAISSIISTGIAGEAQASTQPIQPSGSNVAYIFQVAPNSTKTFTNFRDSGGNAISVTTNSSQAAVGFLLWNGSYWSAMTVYIAVTSPAFETISSDIIQFLDGTTPVYPRTKAEAVFFDNNTNKTLDKEFNQLNQEMHNALDGLIQPSNETVNNRYLDSTGHWVALYWSMVIPISAYRGRHISQTLNSGGQYAFLVSYDSFGVEYVSGGSRVSAKLNNTLIPNDANYLYVYLGSGTSFSPTSLYIEEGGTEGLMKSVENLSKGKFEKIPRIENTEDGIQLKDGSDNVYPRTKAEEVFFDNNPSKSLDKENAATHNEINIFKKRVFGIANIPVSSLTVINGHIGADGILQTTSNYRHVLIPIEHCRGDYITASFTDASFVNSQYAFIASIDTVGNVTTYHFVSGGSRMSNAPENQLIPSDAKWLYLVVAGNNSVVQEGYVSINPVEDTIVEKIQVLQNEKLEASDVLLYYSKNILNPANFAFDRRYSIAELKIISEATLKICSSGLIPVIEGEWYVINGAGVAGINQGGYYGNDATGAVGEASLGNITFVNPVDEVGKCFQVPIGQNIKYVVLNLSTNNDRTAIAGNTQLELGEQATEYTPYNLQPKIKEELLPGGGGGTVETDSELKKYTTFGNLFYRGIGDKIPNFRSHFYAKDKDLCVVNTGTSLTARSSEHCTLLEDAAFRPPLMHSNNFASHIWNKLCWSGQQYRRYDSGFFTETGTGWQTQSNIEDWDDGAYRAGFTRFTNNGGGISFIVPIDAWQFNFIYRSDSQGSESCVVAVAEGNGKMEVWNGSAWVEANGYTFSERESAPTILPSVTYQNYNSGADVTLTDYQVKGNTTYQKRLKMRCKSGTIDSRDITKTVTITNSSKSLLYWGVEWSPRQYMITYINAARGSHSSQVNGEHSLLHWQDNEVWGFKPDLLLSEDPIHNSGGAGVPPSTAIAAYFANVTEQFWFANNGISMKARCLTLGLTEPEWALFNTTITWNFQGINDDGTLKVGPISGGLMWSALESQSSVYMAMKTSHSDIIYINAVKNWVDACMDCYHSMRTATEGSGENGATFTNEGSHWNDTGCRVMARVILPILELID